MKAISKCNVKELKHISYFPANISAVYVTPELSFVSLRCFSWFALNWRISFVVISSEVVL